MARLACDRAPVHGDRHVTTGAVHTTGPARGRSAWRLAILAAVPREGRVARVLTIGADALAERPSGRARGASWQDGREHDGDEAECEAGEQVRDGGHSSLQLVRSAHVPPFDL